MLPLDGVRVLDFSTLLPGPLATLILAEAGAEVLKIERPGGEDLRTFAPYEEGDNPFYAILNRGKRAFAADLKTDAARERMLQLAATCDVLVEQFRPGVMERLGLGYEAVAAANPRIIYCSITGYGQTGSRVKVAGHDLNYLAESGILGIASDSSGRPAFPMAQIADLGGGTFPAIINILLALRQAERSGKGQWLDISMADNCLAWMPKIIAQGTADGRWPNPGQDLVTGGSPRYNFYRTADGRHLAIGALEDRFWNPLCEALGLDPALRDPAADPGEAIAALAAIIGREDAAHWQTVLAGMDVCTSLVVTPEEAMNNPAFAERGLFGGGVERPDGSTMAALPVPIVPAMRRTEASLPYPADLEELDRLPG